MATKGAHIHDAASDTGNCHFMRLPPELRLNIYEYALAEVIIDTNKLGSGSAHAPPLLLTSKTIRHEAADMYWSALVRAFSAQWSAIVDYVQSHNQDFLKTASSLSDTELEEQLENVILLTRTAISELDAMCRLMAGELEMLGRERFEGIHSGKLVASVSTVLMEEYRSKIHNMRRGLIVGEEFWKSRRAERTVSGQM